MSLLLLMCVIACFKKRKSHFSSFRATSNPYGIDHSDRWPTPFHWNLTSRTFPILSRLVFWDTSQNIFQRGPKRKKIHFSSFSQPSRTLRDHLRYPSRPWEIYNVQHRNWCNLESTEDIRGIFDICSWSQAMVNCRVKFGKVNIR